MMKNKKILQPASSSFLVVTLFFLTIIVLLISFDWKNFPLLLTKIDWGWLVLSLFLSFISYISAGISFVLSIKIFSLNLRTKIAFSIGFISTVLANMAPLGILTMTSARFIMLKNAHVKTSDSIALTLFYGYFYNVIFLIFFPISFIILSLKGKSLFLQQAATIISITLTITLTILVFNNYIRKYIFKLLNYITKTLMNKNIHSFNETLENTIKLGIKGLRDTPSLFWKLICFIILDWLTNILCLDFCFIALGYWINLGVLLSGFLLSTALGELSMIPGGFGIQDGSMLGYYSLLGVPTEITIFAIILFRIVYYIIPYINSLILYKKLKYN